MRADTSRAVGLTIVLVLSAACSAPTEGTGQTTSDDPQAFVQVPQGFSVSIFAEGLAGVPGVELLHPVEGNEIFCTMPAALAEGLASRGFLMHPWGPAGAGEMRLVCAFDRTEDEVDALLAAARQLAAAG